MIAKLTICIEYHQVGSYTVHVGLTFCSDHLLTIIISLLLSEKVKEGRKSPSPIHTVAMMLETMLWLKDKAFLHKSRRFAKVFNDDGSL